MKGQLCLGDISQGKLEESLWIWLYSEMCSSARQFWYKYLAFHTYSVMSEIMYLKDIYQGSKLILLLGSFGELQLSDRILGWIS